jgi:hypothetical protein
VRRATSVESSMRRGQGRFSDGGGGQRAGSRRVRSWGAWMQHGERAGAGRRVKSGVDEQQAGRDGAHAERQPRARLGGTARDGTRYDSHAMPRFVPISWRSPPATREANGSAANLRPYILVPCTAPAGRPRCWGERPLSAAVSRAALVIVIVRWRPLRTQFVRCGLRRRPDSRNPVMAGAG